MPEYFEGLTKYYVSLYEYIESESSIGFECWAEDEDHAIEQADNAYPDCEIVEVYEIGE